MRENYILADKLRNADLSGFHVCAGFDAITDCIVRPIRKMSPDGYAYYSDIEEFGQAVISKKALSGIVSLQRKTIKAGGNMTNYACALGTLGVVVDCFGSFGAPYIEEVFSEMPSTCVLHSIGQAGMCIALEFNDGKLMLVDNADYDKLAWKTILDEDKARKLEAACRESDLIALANWSEIKNATEIWRGMLDLLMKNKRKKVTVSIDITDFSYRLAEDVKELAELLMLYCSKTRCVLTLNRNEAMMLFEILCPDLVTDDSIQKAGSYLYEYFSPYMLVIHSAQGASAWGENGIINVGSYYTNHSKICTGAGDNFNAGLSLGILCDLKIEDSICVANALSGYYVREGKCPNLSEICDFIETNHVSAFGID